ncbi:Lrp/AsnC family transcriptional regulator [Rhodovibrionaceae bacterium A322]
MQRKLSDADRKILKVLQTEGRLPNVELAERVGMSPSPCLRRLRQLENDGIISGYSAQVDRRKVGLNVEAFVRVNLERHKDADAKTFVAAVSDMPEVVACYMMAGEMDFLLRVVVADLDAFGQFTRDQLTRVPSVKDVHTSFVIEMAKDSPRVPVDII